MNTSSPISMTNNETDYGPLRLPSAPPRPTPPSSLGPTSRPLRIELSTLDADLRHLKSCTTYASTALQTRPPFEGIHMLRIINQLWSSKADLVRRTGVHMTDTGVAVEAIAEYLDENRGRLAQDYIKEVRDKLGKLEWEIAIVAGGVARVQEEFERIFDDG